MIIVSCFFKSCYIPHTQHVTKSDPYLLLGMTHYGCLFNGLSFGFRVALVWNLYTPSERNVEYRRPQGPRHGLHCIAVDNRRSCQDERRCVSITIAYVVLIWGLCAVCIHGGVIQSLLASVKVPNIFAL